MKKFLIAVLTALVAAGCGHGKAGTGSAGGARPMPADSGSHKSLIVFFSHAGDNYAVGDVQEGNTKVMVEYMKESVDADVFEIVPNKSYDMPYEALTKVARREQEDGELPKYIGDPGNLDRYDTVYVGGPIWWGTYPRVMFTFLKNHNLNGKTLIPFTTHEGSGLGRAVEDLEALYPDAYIKHAFSLYGHEVRGSKDKVKQWIEGIRKADARDNSLRK